ncbi:peptidoglycan DD-metalloendopeptidase family protein [Gammaproteobacteria bacterium]|nr:peptidoglycan DD-metalloendopeptidase family protein [Gammaproteobacteria bacterium]
MNKDPTVFGKDLRYLSKPSRGRLATLGRPSHWVTGAFIAIAVAIWLGSSPGASIERPSKTLQLQIESVIEKNAEPAESQDHLLKTGVSVLPAIEGIRGIESWSLISNEFPLLPPASESPEVSQSPQKEPVNDERPNQVLRSSATASSATTLKAESTGIANKDAAPDAAVELMTPWKTIDIRSGDSLVLIFKRLDLDVTQAIEISKLDGAKKISNLRTGPYLQIQQNDGGLIALRYQPDIKSYLEVTRKNNSYIAETIKRAFDISEKEVSVEITGTLYESAKKAGLPASVVHRVTQIFQWEINFSSDIQPGDRVTVVYEERSLEGQKVGTGPILAVSLENNGKVHHAIRHLDANGVATYYSPKGNSLQRAFLRSPIPGAYISSSFSYNRLHPILKVRRPHLGVDYGARKGTPIVATADGKIIRASRKGGYGKTVIIRHGQEYRTLYAHLSKYGKGIRNGKWVKQGQIIGYVGSTGFSTGPHLHYEIHVGGKARNPQTLKFPRAASISSKEKSNFLEQSTIWVTRLNQIRSAS